MSQVIVVIGPGSIGQAIARRVGSGKHVVLADLRQENADRAAEVMRDAGFDVTATNVDVSSRDSVLALVEAATAHGEITGLVHAAGVSPSQAPVEAILTVDLFGTAVILEEFGHVIARGGAGVVIASQSGHRLGALTPEQNRALGTVPPDDLLSLPMLQADQITDTLHAYQLAKRGNALRVMTCSVDEVLRWPVLVRVRIPRGVRVVERDRPGHVQIVRRFTHVRDFVLEGELRRMDTDDLKPPRVVRGIQSPKVGQRADAVDARVRPEVDQNDLPS